MSNLVTGKFNRNSQFPWNPIEDAEQEFWCERLGIYCKLSREILADGGRTTYHVYQSGTNQHRLYPVLAHEIVPAESKSAKTKTVGKDEFFPINKSNWDQIKNFLVDNFINSYPWENTPEKTHDEIKKQMISMARAPRNGLARLIEIERQEGYFLDKSTFAQRMNKKHESFPWQRFADFLSYETPIT